MPKSTLAIVVESAAKNPVISALARGKVLLTVHSVLLHLPCLKQYQ